MDEHGELLRGQGGNLQTLDRHAPGGKGAMSILER
jgi:hypothetical protein